MWIKDRGHYKGEMGGDRERERKREGEHGSLGLIRATAGGGERGGVRRVGGGGGGVGHDRLERVGARARGWERGGVTPGREGVGVVRGLGVRRLPCARAPAAPEAVDEDPAEGREAAALL